MTRHLARFMGKTNLLSRDGFLLSIILPFIIGLIFLFSFENLREAANLNPAGIVIELKGNPEEKKDVEDFIKARGMEGRLTDQGLEPVGEPGDEDYLIYYFGDDDVDDLLDEGTINAKVWIDNTGKKMDMEIYVPSNKANDRSSFMAYQMLNSFAKTYRNLINNTEALYAQAMAGRDMSSVAGLVERAETGIAVDDIIETKEKEGINSFTHYVMATLGFICLYYIRVGVDIVRKNEAYTGALGKRLAISPVSRSLRVFISFLTTGIPCLLTTYLLLFCCWQRDLGLSLDYAGVILVVSLGVLIAIFMGMAFASLFKLSKDHVNVINVLIPVLGALFGGLMGQASQILSTWINDNAPFLASLNPAGLVSRGLYQLSFYPSYDSFYQTIRIMTVYLAVLAVCIGLGMRRTKE
ncbi:MAG: ABC transporter permease [Bacillota bacterium]|nr:ABC transporter permease [Bacillota bacterium]